MQQATLPAAKRLGKVGVQALLGGGRRKPGSGFDIRYLEAGDPVHGARVAIAVPKRLLKSAVARNRIKRLIREAFRLHSVSRRPMDLLVTYKSRDDCRLKERRTEMREQLLRLFNTLGGTGATAATVR